MSNQKTLDDAIIWLRNNCIERDHKTFATILHECPDDILEFLADLVGPTRESDAFTSGFTKAVHEAAAERILLKNLNVIEEGKIISERE